MAQQQSHHYFLIVCVLAFSLSDVQCWGQWCMTGQWLVICVTNNAEQACQQPSNVTTNLAGVRRALSRSLCAKVYLANGVYPLTRNLDFDAIGAQLVLGASDPRTTIQCGRRDLSFQYSVSVLIFNISFTECPAVFYGIHNLTMENVTVQNMHNSAYGMYTYDCIVITIRNCSFFNNTSGHLRIISSRQEWADPSEGSVRIQGSFFGHGPNENNQTGVKIERYVEVEAKFTIKIFDSVFLNNSAYDLGITEEDGTGVDFLNVLIKNCKFIGTPFGFYAAQLSNHDNRLAISALGCTFRQNQYAGVIVRNANSVYFDRCKMHNSRGTAISIIKTYPCIEQFATPIIISRVNFSGNSRALAIGNTHCYQENDNRMQKVLIRNSTFNSHIMNEGYAIKLYDTLRVYAPGNSHDIAIAIHDSEFTNNHAVMKSINSTSNFDCSVLYAFNVTLTVRNVSFINNTCTGIMLNSTILKIQSLFFSQNYATRGGALRLVNNDPQPKRSAIIFFPNASLHCSHNRASEYGGAIYSEENCDTEKRECFFQLELMQTHSPIFNFTGNRADKGGDVIFGGCLSGCYQKNTSDLIDLTDADNIFWNLVSLSQEDISQSSFAEHPNRVAFCALNSQDPSRPTCTDKHDQITMYRGGTFSVEMMVTGKSCYPSYNIIHASIPQEQARGVEMRKGESYKEAKPYCDRHSFTLQGGQGSANNFTLDIVLDFQENRIGGNKLTHLTVNYLNQCPAGFLLDETEDACRCIPFLESRGIECIERDYSFRVPALTWVGTWHGEVAVGTTCQFCKASGVHTITNLSSSEDLCVESRAAILCGQCVRGYSIKLGGYTCGDCKTSSYQGYLLTLFFAIIGFVLVIILLKLNLTVSTGLINGLIFYSNVVYSNHSVFLPLDRDNHGHLNNAVHFLFIFKAWLNLDFGFDTCYFHGTDTYIVTWLQFVFPIYIWLIILAIVVSSRYSTRISKFTGHNTISVLATLLLLSYTKLLLAVLSAFSYTQLDMEGQVSYPLWAPDANIRYLSGKHVWLFLMSFFMILAYIIPFTLLVCLGPLLMARSNFKLLRWAHQLVRPFLDAFYGPYTRAYVYWPGILLLLRIVLVCMIAFYSTGDGSVIALSIAMAVVFLLLLWQLIGKTHQVSLHRKKKLNLLELFFILNLSFFSIISLYVRLKYPKVIEKQQVLAVVMVGSVFTVFCCIVAYNILCVVKAWTLTRMIMKMMRSKKGEAETAVQQEPLDGDSLGTYYDNRAGADKKAATRTELEMPQLGKNELREPLLEPTEN